MNPDPHWPSIGELVSVERWDATERPENRIGSPATVTAKDHLQYSQSSVMVTVVGTSGRTLRVDTGWLRPLEQKI